MKRAFKYYILLFTFLLCSPAAAGQENLSIFYRAGIMEFTAQNHLVTGEPLFIYIDGQRIKLN